jgi:hypothetical protein
MYSWTEWLAWREDNAAACITCEYWSATVVFTVAVQLQNKDVQWE